MSELVEAVEAMATTYQPTFGTPLIFCSYIGAQQIASLAK